LRVTSRGLGDVYKRQVKVGNEYFKNSFLWRTRVSSVSSMYNLSVM
jgi:hypothetical protein